MYWFELKHWHHRQQHIFLFHIYHAVITHDHKNTPTHSYPPERPLMAPDCHVKISIWMVKTQECLEMSQWSSGLGGGLFVLSSRAEASLAAFSIWSFNGPVVVWGNPHSGGENYDAPWVFWGWHCLKIESVPNKCSSEWSSSRNTTWGVISQFQTSLKWCFLAAQNWFRSRLTEWFVVK